MTNTVKITLIAIGLFVASIVAINFGSVDYSIGKIIDILFMKNSGIDAAIIWESRMPRIIAAILVGGLISISGCLFQAVTRNPLADPGILGVSSGASFAVVLYISVFSATYIPIQIVAFLGGCIATLCVFVLTWKNGIEPLRLILSGVIINSTLGAGISFLMITYPEKFQGALYWLNGSLSGKTWFDVKDLLIFGIPGLVISFFLINRANLILLGDDMASNLGVNVSRTIIMMCALASYLTGISISTVGLIGFIGLVSPHISRLLVGPNHKHLLPLSFLMGGLIVVCADIFARTLLKPVEISIGIMMAMVGGPFFIYLLRKKGGYGL